MIKSEEIRALKEVNERLRNQLMLPVGRIIIVFKRQQKLPGTPFATVLASVGSLKRLPGSGRIASF
jgi:hypothetical protein